MKSEIHEYKPEVITNESLITHINHINEIGKNVCKSFLRGLLCKEEVYKEIIGSFRDEFHAFLKNSDNGRMSLDFNIDNSNWECFCEEYNEWKTNKEIQSEVGDWLCYGLDDLHSGVKRGDKASPLDKIKLFKFIAAFDMPIEYFEPEPVVRPDLIRSEHNGCSDFQSRTIRFVCQNNTDSILNLTAVGTNVVIVDQYGLRAEIQITDVISNPYKKRTYHPDIALIGSGTIEGYTSSRKRDIEIYWYLADPDYYYFEYIQDKDDSEIMKKFPLWEEYHKYIKRQNDVRSKFNQSLVERYMDLEKYEKT